MEKEKILRELEKKLLPSVQNLEKEQATDHDFLPALLWILLEKSKNSESILNNIVSKHSEEFEKISKTIVENNQENKKNYEELLAKAVNFIVSKNQESIKKIETIKNWFLVSFMFHIITLIILVILLKKSL
jgi:hypothetical protein